MAREEELVEVKPRKSLGQNFLVAGWVARIFASWACNFSRLLEVGVGKGFLTRTVARQCPHSYIIGLEVDPRLTPHLVALQFYYDNVSIILSDALAPPVKLDGVDAVYGSIPYNITSPLLELLSLYARKPALLLLQKEVGERLASKPGTSKYGRITVLVQLVYTVKLHSIVPPSAFKPKPKVYSRIVELKPKPTTPSPEELKAVEQVTRCMFSQRNKRAGKVIARCCGKHLAELLEERYGDNRVYQLSPEAFLEIAKLCTA